MESLFDKHWNRLQNTNLTFERGIMSQIDWNSRLIGIKGARGTGKTTLLLQYIKKNLPPDHTSLYISLDNIWFTENKLSSLVDTFTKKGGKYLFVDEVHKYPNWAIELKNFYDDYPALKIVFTGSSLLEILNSRADLSRRAVTYHMQGLSFREYINLSKGYNFGVFSLPDILNNHLSIAQSILQQIRPFEHFDGYLKHGYYPFYFEYPALYNQRLEEVLNMIVEIELPLLRQVEIAYTSKIKQLLQIISQSVPFIPNVTKISERIGINRATMLTYLHYLQEAHLTINLYKSIKGISKLQKPDKIFLENTNLMHTLSPNTANKGNLRETFIANQIGYNHQIEFSDEGDFLVDGQYTIEIGGRRKTGKQIRQVEKAFIVSDDIEYGIDNKIPIWLFGFLY